MKEIFLLKLGEIVLKGANKRQFESRLRQNVRRRMADDMEFLLLRTLARGAVLVDDLHNTISP